jgi:hypothetical protein
MELSYDVINIVSRARHLAEERPRKRTCLDEDADNVFRLPSDKHALLLESSALSTETSKSLPLVVVLVSPKSSQPAQNLPARTNI